MRVDRGVVQRLAVHLEPKAEDAFESVLSN